MGVVLIKWVWPEIFRARFAHITFTTPPFYKILDPPPNGMLIHNYQLVNHVQLLLNNVNYYRCAAGQVSLQIFTAKVSSMGKKQNTEWNGVWNETWNGM